MTGPPPFGLAVVGHAAGTALAAWLIGVFAVMAWKAFAGARPPRSAPRHMHRLQLLATTWAVGGYYAATALLGKSGGAMPDISPFVLALLGVSHSTFLSGKAVRTMAAHRRRRRLS